MAKKKEEGVLAGANLLHSVGDGGDRKGRAAAHGGANPTPVSLDDESGHRTDLRPPDFRDVLDARRTVGRHLRITPLLRYPSIERLTGTETWIKHENQQLTGAFKVRGGINLVSRLTRLEREASLIAASSGNHGLSIAFAAQRFGVKAKICVPQEANPVKLEAMEHLGAKIIVHGRDYDAAREYCEEISRQRGYRYVHSGDEPLLIAGVATYALEIFEEQPDVDTVIVPIGGGSGAAGTCIVGKTIRSDLQVIGVQSSAAPAAYRSWKERALVSDETHTEADGLATRTAFSLPQRILWNLLDDFVLLDDEEFLHATFHMVEKTRTLVEPSGAAALAAAISLRERLANKKVVLICSGANISPVQLRSVIERFI